MTKKQYVALYIFIKHLRNVWLQIYFISVQRRNRLLLKEYVEHDILKLKEPDTSVQKQC